MVRAAPPGSVDVFRRRRPPQPLAWCRVRPVTNGSASDTAPPTQTERGGRPARTLLTPEMMESFPGRGGRLSSRPLRHRSSAGGGCLDWADSRERLPGLGRRRDTPGTTGTRNLTGKTKADWDCLNILCGYILFMYLPSSSTEELIDIGSHHVLEAQYSYSH